MEEDRQASSDVEGRAAEDSDAVSTAIAQSCKEKNVEKVSCPEHSGWNLSFYCMQCYSFVCAQCVYKGSHLGHKFRPMMKAIEVVQATFEEQITKLADRRAALREFSHGLPGMLPALAEERMRATKASDGVVSKRAH